MNYYPHHIGDYASATAHLTMLEDCAYRRLLDWYYLDERPLPLDARTVYRRVRAASEAEREAVDIVLSEFFTKTEDGYQHARCDAEIERSHIKSDERRAAADKRWNAKRSQAECKTDANAQGSDAIASTGDAKAMHSQEPITNNQEPIAKEEKQGAKQPAPLPDGFAAFWAAYPNTDRKVRKADCLKAWRKEGLERRADAIVAHVEAMRQTSGWIDGYEPAPLTYLNQHRFDDEIPENRRPPPQRMAAPVLTANQQMQQNVIGAIQGRSTRETFDVDATEVFTPLIAR